MTVEEMAKSQKAAALVVALGQETASQVMAHLAPDEVERLAMEIANLGEIPGEDVARILEEFHDEAIAHGHLVTGGIDYARNLLRRTHGAHEADTIIERLLATVSVSPFAFLRQRDPEQLVQYLQGEHPQTVALILAHLPPNHAARLMAGFDTEMQNEVALRVATMEATSPEVIARVEQALRGRLGHGRDELSRKGGVRDLAAILNNSDRTTERAILGGLEHTDPDLAEEVRALMFVFEDIVNLDDRALQEVLREVDTQTLAMAMKGVRDDVREKILGNISQRAADTLVEELEVLGAVRVRDVEAAQTEVVGHVRRLEEEGRIVIKRGAEADVIE